MAVVELIETGKVVLVEKNEPVATVVVVHDVVAELAFVHLIEFLSKNFV